MSLINEYRATEDAIKELQSRLAQLSSDDRLKTELEFEGKLRKLMGEYQKSLRDIINLLDPTPAKTGAKQAAPKARRARVVKVYQNPHTGELIETKGGNHRGLKAWKEQYGAGTVDSWLRS